MKAIDPSPILFIVLSLAPRTISGMQLIVTYLLKEGRKEGKEGGRKEGS